MSTRILIADHQILFRQGIRLLLEQQSGIEVLGEAGNGREAVKLAEQLRPDVVLIDVTIPVLNGIEATRQIREHLQTTHVIALATQAESRFIGQMLRAGASGYVVKNTPLVELLQAIEVVARGGTFLSPIVTDLVISHYVRGENESFRSEYESLTRREREVMQLLSEGQQPRQIACQLKVSVKTVDTHRHHIMRKLKFRGMADLTRYALREGIS
jgi:two-component system, NarL family, response regulator NreC